MKHVPVLLNECIEALQIKDGGVYIDGTVGYGGHAEAILKSGRNITLIGFDRDEEAIASTSKRLKGENVRLHHASYHQIPEYLTEPVDGILLDLGASSPQFDKAERGFSIKQDGPLDMRFDISQQETAADIVNTYREDDLYRILKDYGEERFARKIAKAIVSSRKDFPIETTSQLTALIEDVIPRKFWPRSIHPATKTFQALRIEVNNELNILTDAIPALIAMLKPGGRLAVISFHSLEDRIVKQAFKKAEKSCICPKEFPVCRCDKEQTAKIITKKPVTASKIQIKQNVRARSAKLRVIEHV
jgi:16S rRNA (cytosine1402-N4)-methyltransferase